MDLGCRAQEPEQELIISNCLRPSLSPNGAIMLRRYGLWPILIFGLPTVVFGTIVRRYHPWSLIVVLVLFIFPTRSSTSRARRGVRQANEAAGAGGLTDLADLGCSTAMPVRTERMPPPFKGNTGHPKKMAEAVCPSSRYQRRRNLSLLGSEEPKVCRLSARTIGSAGGARHPRGVGLVRTGLFRVRGTKHKSHEPASKTWSCHAGPMVRIRLPPAASHTNFEGHRTQARIGCDQIASWLAGQGRDGFVDRRVVMDGSSPWTRRAQ